MFNNQFRIRSQMLADALNRTENFNISQSVCGGNYNSALAIDESRLLVCLLSIVGKDQVSRRVIQAGQVLSAEIITDQASKSNVLLNQVTGAVIGGALFGDAGAIVGADSGIILAAGIKSIDLQITLNDTSNPFHQVSFFPDRLNMRKNKNQALMDAQRWQVLMGIMAKRAAESGRPGIYAPQSRSIPSEPAARTSEPARLPQPASRLTPGPRCILKPALGTSQPPVHVTSDSFTIGRGAGNDLMLQDSSVSRQHAVLRFANGAWFIQDRESRAGTLVNGQHIQAARLSNGCHIGIGAQTFIFTME